METAAAIEGALLEHKEERSLRAVLLDHAGLNFSYGASIPEHMPGPCAEMLAGDGGVDAAIDQIKASLPARLRETAYAFACEIVAADGHASQEELQFLEVLSYDLEIDPLAAAAIQRGARARHARM